jgi:hypothetical protein
MSGFRDHKERTMISGEKLKRTHTHTHNTRRPHIMNWITYLLLPEYADMSVHISDFMFILQYFLKETTTKEELSFTYLDGFDNLLFFLRQNPFSLSVCLPLNTSPMPPWDTFLYPVFEI